MSMFRVALILQPYNKTWILEKIAHRLQEHLKGFDFTAEMSDRPLRDVDVNHHMSWAFANLPSNVPSTMFITHLDNIYKIKQVKSELKHYVDMGICISSDTVQQLKNFGIRSEALCFIPPAHDGLVSQKRIVIGITTRVYPDGRKREDLLVRLAGDLRLDAFEFRIFGKGWEDVISKLEKAGAKVTYFQETDDYQKDYETILRAIPVFDYYLYLGKDEGSLGTLDALASGVKTIITPQGFHLDIPHGITHPVMEYKDVLDVFRSLANDMKNRLEGVSNLNWREYARRHSLVWRQLIAAGRTGDIQHLLSVPQEAVTREYKGHAVGGSRYDIYRRALNPHAIVSSVSHLPVLRGIRAMIHKRKKA